MFLAGFAHAAESDWLRTDVPGSALPLEAKGRRQADAMAYFMTGLFTEENVGPEKALESKRKVLELDPGCTDLAIEVSGEYLRGGDTDEAITVLKNAIAAAPKITSPYLALSMICLRQLQKPELAAKYAQQCVEIAPRSFGGYALLLEIYQGQPARTAKILEKAAQSKSGDPAFWVSMAELNLRDGTQNPETRGKIDRFLAEAALQATLHDEGKLDVFSKVGDVYVKLADLPQAILYYNKVLEAKPTFPHIRERLAACYIETDQVAPAIAQVEELVHADPLSLPAYEQLTQLYLKSGDLNKALANARQALLLEPANIDRHLLVVRLLFSLKKMNDAANALAEARLQFPQVVRLTHLYGVALNEAARHEEALRAFEQAVVEASGDQSGELDSQFYFDYGAAAEQAGQYVQAADLFRQSIAMDPAHSAEACNYLGYMWADRGENLDEAERLIRQAVATQPDNGAYLDSLGWLLFKQGKYDDSLATLLSAGEHLPEPDPIVLDHIADVYRQMGKQAEAVLYWQKALQLDPGNKQLIAKLDQASDKVAQQPDKAADAPK